MLNPQCRDAWGFPYARKNVFSVFLLRSLVSAVATLSFEEEAGLVIKAQKGEGGERERQFAGVGKTFG